MEALLNSVGNPKECQEDERPFFVGQVSNLPHEEATSGKFGKRSRLTSAILS